MTATPLIKIFHTTALSVLISTALTGCYVEVSHELEADYDTEVHYSAEINDFNTPFLVDAAIIPFALSAESPYMVIDPDAYTTPRARDMSRALIIETTYSYLFDDWDCDYGGFTQTEAEAETTAYNDGYTYVELTMNAQAYDCEVYNRGNLHQINSNLDYRVSGWYDDWAHEISSVDALLSGDVNVEFNGKYISHDGVWINTQAVSANDFSMFGNSRVTLDDGFDTQTATLNTSLNVHFNLGESHPHQGVVTLQNGYSWVRLTFESEGVWREDDDGFETYWRWTELGFS